MGNRQWILTVLAMWFVSLSGIAAKLTWYDMAQPTFIIGALGMLGTAYLALRAKYDRDSSQYVNPTGRR